MEAASNRLTDNGKPDSKTWSNSIENSDETMLYTKFMTPSPSLDYVSRSHLLERLDQVINKRLTLISAPAGYGKTTLISMWLYGKGTSLCTAWVSLDEKDNNLQIFWQYILMAIEKSISGCLSDYTQMDCVEMKFSMDILLNGLMNRLYNKNEAIVLVLDDYHYIRDERIHDSMQYFINYLPANMHVVIVSRSIPPIKHARIRTHGELLELGTEDLRLTYCEVSDFLKRTMKLDIDESDLRRLEQLTEGWIAALVLTALRINKGHNIGKYLDGYTTVSADMVDYLSEEVFSLLDESLKDFLLKTSILNTLDAGLCNAVAGIDNSKDIIEFLDKSNIFTSALDNERDTYRYHSLFKDFLKNKLEELHSDIIGELYLRASRYYETKKLIKEAFEYSVSYDNPQNTVRLIEEYGEIMIVNRDMLKLVEIVEALPRHIIENNINIYMLYTFAVVGRNASGTNGIFICNRHISLESRIFDEHKTELLIIRMVLAYANEDFRTAISYGNGAVENLSDKCAVSCLPYKILAQIYCAEGNCSKAEYFVDLYIDTLRRKDHYSSFFIDTMYIHMIGHILCGAGKYKEALDILKDFEGKLSINKIPFTAITNSIYLNLGYLYYELGEMELSQKNIEKCIELSSLKMDIFRLISCYVLVARINCSNGNYASMMVYIKKAEDLCDSYNFKFMIISLFIYIARVLISAGEMEYADCFAQKYDIKVEESFDIQYEDAHLALADIYVANKDFDKAESLLDRLECELTDTERNFNYVRVLILKSLLSKYRCNETEAICYMKEALERAVEHNYISTFSEFGVPAAEIIGTLVATMKGTDFKSATSIDYAMRILSHIKKSENYVSFTDPELLSTLTKRETEVLDYVLSGLTNKEISERLFVAESTVKKHLNNIYGKIGVVNRTQVSSFYKKSI